MKLSQKGSANMWWIIIGAVIAIVVLVILLMIFTGKTRGVAEELSGCEGKGGVCVAEGCPKNTLKSGLFQCSDDNFCCLGSPQECVDSDFDCIVDHQGKSWEK